MTNRSGDESTTPPPRDATPNPDEWVRPTAEQLEAFAAKYRPPEPRYTAMMAWMEKHKPAALARGYWSLPLPPLPEDPREEARRED